MRKKNLSLKARLVATVTALLFIGVLISDIATYSALKSFLVSKLDDQLSAAVQPASRALNRAMQGQPQNQAAFASVPYGSYGELIFKNGASFIAAFVQNPSQAGSPPNIPQPTKTRQSLPLDTPFNVRSNGSPRLHYRVIAQRDPGTGNIIVLAIPLSGVMDTLARLVLIELFVSLGALIFLVTVGWYLVSLGLRPLDRMAETANEISEGNLLARVETNDNHGTEVARLAKALNSMLSQLITALERRGQSEAKLRRFVADASHELRTPLTSIRGYAELVRNRSGFLDESETKRAMERIESESIRMGSLVEDLLLLARLDQNRPLDKEPVDISEITNDLADDFHTVDPCREITLEVDDDLWVMGDKNRIAQVIANLLSNVRYHTPDCTSVKVEAHHISIEEVDQHNGLEVVRADEKPLLSDSPNDFEIIRVAVTDHGPGIEPHALKSVFERFYRTESSRSRVSGGTGLGLSLVASIVSAHGGSAWVASKGNGEGATFGFDLIIDVSEVNDSETIEPEL